jgi:hypothetical protein
MSPLLVVKVVGAQTAFGEPDELLELDDELELATVLAPEEDEDELELEDEEELELAVVEATPELLELAWVVDPLLVLVELDEAVVVPLDPVLWLPVLLELPDLFPEQAVEAARRVRDTTSASRFI